MYTKKRKHVLHWVDRRQQRIKNDLFNGLALWMVNAVLAGLCMGSMLLSLNAMLGTFGVVTVIAGLAYLGADRG